ncbi:MAG: hypothetical protein HMLKMBBP_01963 [Planctomycetes bacterium]|nr:hypothetical protein [Planctomycetota bacterium]
MSTTPRAPTARDAAAAWRSPLTVWSLALFLFLAISGIWIWAAPATAFAEGQTIVHTLAGIAFLAVSLAYLPRHVAQTIRQPVSHVAVLGWTSGTILLAVLVSGVVVTAQAAAGTRVDYGWALVHTAAGISCSVLVVLHCGFAAIRFFRARVSEDARTARAATNRAMAFAGSTTAVLMGASFGVAAAAPRISDDWSLPADYGMKYGSSPFAPSLARTKVEGVVNAPIAPEALAGSRRCGNSGCHEEILREWEPSAHRYASRSMFFQAIQKAMAASNGPDSTRYCAGCHDPIALYSGSKNIYDEDLSSMGADEGLSCVACHAITETDVKGNAAYVIEPQHRVLWEGEDGGFASAMSGFLIRSLPRAHKAAWTRDLQKTPEFCGACHKQFIDEQINGVGWVQLQNQYDHWRKSRWFQGKESDPQVADPTVSISCRECHMPLRASEDPAAGDVKDYNRAEADGKHRGHRFLGANQWHPTLHALPGGEEQVKLTEKWLRGEYPVPEIADKWTSGPAVPVQLVVPAAANPGETVPVQVVVTSNKVGHDFPTGPLDIIQSWVELTVADEQGKTVFESGRIDERGYLSEGAFIFKAEGIDRQGNLIDKHNLWEMVGARFKRALFPGYSDTAEYQFTCPSALSRTEPVPPKQEIGVAIPAGASGKLTVTARLLYRKVDQTLIDFVYPGKGLTAPITEVSRDQAVVVVAPKGD